MRREILTLKAIGRSCCPGHDNWPCETYSTRASKRARSKGKTREHKYARTLAKREMIDEM